VSNTTPSTRPSVIKASSATPAERPAASSVKQPAETKGVSVETPVLDPLRAQLSTILKGDSAAIVKELSGLDRSGGGSLHERVKSAHRLIDQYCAGLQEAWGKPATQSLASGLKAMVCGVNGVLVCKIDDASVAKLVKNQVVPLQVALVEARDRADRVAKEQAEAAEAFAEKERTRAASERERTALASIGLREFYALQEGMTYKDVRAILGCDGVLQGSAKIADIRTELLYWDVGFMKGISLLFQNGRLVSKTQLGLR
jgi:hypothetical protein